jgi:dTDP-4-amino-4,6-dideoxygalactose transaminase
MIELNPQVLSAQVKHPQLKNRKKVFEALQEKGIGVNVHYIPIHLQPYYQQIGFKQGDFPHAEHFYENAITLPLYPGLTEDDQQAVVDALFEVLK